jgi:DNA-binding PadR family transcriptional regulator
VNAGPSILVLTSLSNGPKHGYAIMEDIERFSGLRLGPGTLYGAITRLEQRKWIVPVASKDRRKPYKLTPTGAAHLKDQLGMFARVVNTATKRLKYA